jgi:hypothetical protein
MSNPFAFPVPDVSPLLNETGLKLDVTSATASVPIVGLIPPAAMTVQQWSVALLQKIVTGFATVYLTKTNINTAVNTVIDSFVLDASHFNAVRPVNVSLVQPDEVITVVVTGDASLVGTHAMMAAITGVVGA